MKLSAAEQESIVALMTNICLELAALEERFVLQAGEGDFRPRIEYFHDAVRAFTAGVDKEREPGGRLSIEMLAYDLAALRFLQAKPLSSFRGQNDSPKTDLITSDKGLTVKRERPDRATRERLVELYQNYAMLYAALLKPLVDRDYKERTETAREAVDELKAVADACKGEGEGLPDAVLHVEDDAIRAELAALLRHKKVQGKEDLKQILQKVKAHIARKNKAVAAIESAHMDYAVNQLGIYESSKDMLKKMATKGINLVGKFVEASVASARQQMHR